MMDLQWFLERLEEDLGDLEVPGWPPDWDEGDPLPLEVGPTMWVGLTVRAPDGSYEVAALECPVDSGRLPDVVGHAGWAATRSAGKALERLYRDLHGRYEAWPRRGVALSSPTATAPLSGDSPADDWAAEDGSCLPDWRVAPAAMVAAEGESLLDLVLDGFDDPAGHAPRGSLDCSILMHGPDGATYEVADGDLLATGVRADGDRVVLDLEAPWELVVMPGSPLLAAHRLALGPLFCGGFGPPPC